MAEGGAPSISGPRGVLFEGGIIHTLDIHRPQATALAVQGEWIVAAGDTQDLRDSFPSFTRVGLDGRTVLPAFTDSHIHLAGLGLALRSVNLRESRSLREAVASVAAAISRAQPGGWIRGGRWDKNLWPEGRFPRREDLDPVTGDHPVALLSKDGHTMWVNSLALALAGITAATVDPPGGRIVRDPATGEPAGLLAERAADLITAVADRPTPEALDAAIRDASKAALQHGIVGVHIMEGGDVLAALQRLRSRGALEVRACMMIPEDGLEAAIQVGVRSGFGDTTLRVGGVKIFADGALGSQTASMLDPYEGQPDNTGVAVRSREELTTLVRRAAAHGLAAVIHAIGDRANRWALDALEAAAAETGRAGLRHRVEHVQLLHPADLPRLAALGAVASVQPIHCTQDRDLADRYWGRRSRYAYAFRSLLQCGTHLAFGSDAPVETPDVLAGIYAAVTRRRQEEPDGPPWYPEECLTVEEAVRAYTIGAAYASGEEGYKGILAPGRLADFVALSRDPFKIPAAELPSVRIDLTVMGGVIRYASSSGSGGSHRASSSAAASSTPAAGSPESWGSLAWPSRVSTRLSI